MQRTPTNKAAILTSKENATSSNFTRLPRPSHRSLIKLLQLLLRHGTHHQRCPNRSRGDGVHPNALSDELVGKASGEGYNGPFGGGVVEEVWTTDVMVDGGHVYYCA